MERSAVSSQRIPVVLLLLVLGAEPVIAQERTFRPLGTLGIGVERTASLSLADVDGDGDLDIIVANGRHWPAENEIHLNDGRGGFVVSRPLGTEGATSYAARLADFDGDGDLDIATGNDRARNLLFRNDGTGRFEEIGTFGSPASTRNLTIADLNGDGHADILVVNRGQQNMIHFGDGVGGFSRGKPFGSGDDSTIHVAAADVDADGDLDLVVANRDGQPNFVYLNDGHGDFGSSVPYGSGHDETRSVAVSDMNGDDRLDIVAGNIGEPNAVYYADGAGGFERGPEFGRDSDNTYSIAVADLDLDGDPDVVAGNVGSQNAVYFNDPALGFTEERFGCDECATYTVAIGDVNGDGYPDVATANSGSENTVYVNVPRVGTGGPYGVDTRAQETEAPLRLRYFGAAGWEISDGNVVVLIDPYISRLKYGGGGHPDDDRPDFAREDVAVSDTALIDDLVTRADFVLVHHAHFDHLGDVPYIARKTGAKVIGTETTITILRAYGVPEEQLYAVGGGEDYQFDDFSVRVLPSIHSALGEKHYFDSRRYDRNTHLEAPLRIDQFIEGGSLMFLARFDRHEVLTMGSMNFVERELEGVSPDILLAGVNGSRLGLYRYDERLLNVTGRPPIIIPTHWDNFRLPYGLSQEAAVERNIIPFIDAVAAISPRSRVITPTHLETIIIN
jgi:L-ascorbate metabolism protein UlaG (beta-lactamase superfamily)